MSALWGVVAGTALVVLVLGMGALIGAFWVWAGR